MCVHAQLAAGPLPPMMAEIGLALTCVGGRKCVRHSGHSSTFESVRMSFRCGVGLAGRTCRAMVVDTSRFGTHHLVLLAMRDNLHERGCDRDYRRTVDDLCCAGSTRHHSHRNQGGLGGNRGRGAGYANPRPLHASAPPNLREIPKRALCPESMDAERLSAKLEPL